MTDKDWNFNAKETMDLLSILNDKADRSTVEENAYIMGCELFPLIEEYQKREDNIKNYQIYEAMTADIQKLYKQMEVIEGEVI